ncbi:hypothetical protein L873DRAFT_1086829 [Choiromyces venosus 120613-1]|uniref:Uncharacterized protein n=1 Tax=Choiromyces venosus 120613-1 TaxID=1336337 RepID=A0A3N4JHL4_9PEZI|nr:hypothetical protein L873DRAFT_1086829 [Choiromyces venosus 120613-1]
MFFSFFPFHNLRFWVRYNVLSRFFLLMLAFFGRNIIALQECRFQSRVRVAMWYWGGHFRSVEWLLGTH